MTMLPIVILAGGKATRLYPITKDTPKSMLMFNEKPFIQYQIELLKSNGFDQIHFCLGEFSEQITDFLIDNDFFDINISYSTDEPLLGTGGALRNSLNMFFYNAFFIMYGDSFLPVDYKKIQDGFLESSDSALMTIYKNNNEYDKSNVEYKRNKIIKYDKINTNENMHYIDYGLSILLESMLEDFPRNKEFDLSLIYQKALSENRLQPYVVHNRFYEIGSLEGIKEFQNYIGVE